MRSGDFKHPAAILIEVSSIAVGGGMGLAGGVVCCPFLQVDNCCELCVCVCKYIHVCTSVTVKEAI